MTLFSKNQRITVNVPSAFSDTDRENIRKAVVARIQSRFSEALEGLEAVRL